MPKLRLNKRTIANLNNMEMRYVYGGGGDDDISRDACGNDPDSEINAEFLEKLKKILLSQALGCKIG